MDPSSGPAEPSSTPARLTSQTENLKIPPRPARHLLPWPQVGYPTKVTRERALLIEAAIFESLGQLSELQAVFWSALVAWAPDAPIAKAVSRRLGLRVTTFNSRFVRNGLPTPKEYLVNIRLCYAARLFDEGEQTISQVAFRLHYSSPQSFARHLMLYGGITPTEFKARCSLSVALDRMTDSLILPYASILARFSPLEYRGCSS